MRRWHGFYRLELRRVRIVARHAQRVCLFTVPIACSLAVYPQAPVLKLGPVAFSAKQIRLVELDRLSITQRQEVVPILSVVAVKTPNKHSAVVELHVLVDQQVFPPLEVHRKSFSGP